MAPGRPGRRAVRRGMRRRRRRRRIVIGGAVLLAGSRKSRKMSQQDVDKIEQHTGESVEDLSEESLEQAQTDLNIQELPMDENDQAAAAKANAEAEAEEKEDA